MSPNNLVLLISALVSFCLGGFVYAQGRGKILNVTLALLSLATFGWCFGQFMGEVVSTKGAVLFWTRFNLAAAVFIPLFYFHFVLALVGRLSRAKLFLALAYLAAGALLVLVLTPLFVADVAPYPGYRFYPVPGPAYSLFALYLGVLFLAGFAQLVGQAWRGVGAEQNQAFYVLLASIVGFLGGMTAFFPVFNLNWPVVSYYAMPLYLALTVYAIVKHRLLEIDVVFRTGLVYTVLTVFFAGFYALGILLAGRAFQEIIHFSGPVATLVVVFISVIVFQPLKDRVQAWVDRLFARGSYYYQQLVNDLSAENIKLYRGLIQADKLGAIGVIAAGMAHEIKNPLASIKGLTQVLPENLDDKEFIVKYIEIVPRQLDRINRIVEDLLAFSQPKELVVRPVDPEKVLTDVLRLVEGQCRKAGITVVTDCRPVPALQADPERLDQVFMNIILNAIQAMPNGGTVNVKCQMTNDKCLIEISDSGQGIPAEKLPNIFDPFYTTKERGSGLGLAVTYRIVKEHGGEITAESQAGKGTTFKIWLPTAPKRSV